MNDRDDDSEDDFRNSDDKDHDRLNSRSCLKVKLTCSKCRGCTAN